MNALLQFFCTTGAAAGLMTVGLAVALCGVYRGVADARRQARDPMRALAIVRAFRVGIVGLTLAGLGAAWCWHLAWLLGLSLIIGGEELLESTVAIAALRRDVQRRKRCSLVSVQ